MDRLAVTSWLPLPCSTPTHACSRRSMPV